MILIVFWWEQRLQDWLTPIVFVTIYCTQYACRSEEKKRIYVAERYCYRYILILRLIALFDTRIDILFVKKKRILCKQFDFHFVYTIFCRLKCNLGSLKEDEEGRERESEKWKYKKQKVNIASKENASTVGEWKKKKN